MEIFILPLLKKFIPKLKERELICKNQNYVLNSNSGKRIWFHSASMGEFEQAKPIIEQIKQNNPDTFIICTFFSPSGFNNQKNYKFADKVLYIPLDTKENAKLFIEKINPDLVVFVRYEIWRNHLLEVKKRNIPLILMAATAPRSFYLTKLPILKNFTKTNYNLFDYIFTINDIQTEFFNKYCENVNIITSTDPRFDRILNKVEAIKDAKPLSCIKFDNIKILVAGSTWKKDEEFLLEAFKLFKNKHKKKFFPIIVPHEPNPEHIEVLSLKFNKPLLYSEIEYLKEFDDYLNASDYDCIIVDTIGKLLELYSLADLAYIGGAFGAGVHSVTEPAGFGIPLAAGKKIDNSPDAIQLFEMGVLNKINNSKDIYLWLQKYLSNEEERLKVGNLAKNYLFNSKGASNVIANKIKELLTEIS